MRQRRDLTIKLMQEFLTTQHIKRDPIQIKDRTSAERTPPHDAAVFTAYVYVVIAVELLGGHDGKVATRPMGVKWLCRRPSRL